MFVGLGVKFQHVNAWKSLTDMFIVLAWDPMEGQQIEVLNCNTGEKHVSCQFNKNNDTRSYPQEPSNKSVDVEINKNPLKKVVVNAILDALRIKHYMVECL